MCASINVVSQKEVVCIWQLSSDFEYLQDVEKLAVNVTYDCDWYWDTLHIFLQNEDIFEFMAEDVNGLLLKYLAFENLFQETVDIEPHFY